MFEIYGFNISFAAVFARSSVKFRQRADFVSRGEFEERVN
jgi:hypothetical protein